MVPPGHGDLYPTLLDSGILDQLIEAGFRYASVSNSDNLGCGPCPSRVGLPAVARRMPQRSPPARRWTSKLWPHRAPPGRRPTDPARPLRPHRRKCSSSPTPRGTRTRTPTTSGSTWSRSRTKLTETGGVFGLPSSAMRRSSIRQIRPHRQVHQPESRHGAAIEVFDGARVIVVPRDRFIPVKTTNEPASRVDRDAVTWDQALTPPSASPPRS